MTRYVRTPDGAKRFGQPIGTPIVPDVLPPGRHRLGDPTGRWGVDPTQHGSLPEDMVRRQSNERRMFRGTSDDLLKMRNRQHNEAVKWLDQSQKRSDRVGPVVEAKVRDAREGRTPLRSATRPDGDAEAKKEYEEARHVIPRAMSIHEVVGYREWVNTSPHMSDEQREMLNTLLDIKRDSLSTEAGKMVLHRGATNMFGKTVDPLDSERRTALYAKRIKEANTPGKLGRVERQIRSDQHLAMIHMDRLFNRIKDRKFSR